MSYNHALADNIKIDTSKVQTKYYPPCRFCGQEVVSFNYIRHYVYACKFCRPKKKLLLSTGLFDKPSDRRTDNK